MGNWYQTQEGCSLQHEGLVVGESQKIFLTDEQAKLHNSLSEQVVKCDADKPDKSSTTKATSK
jgi:hypothetical protein